MFDWIQKVFRLAKNFNFHRINLLFEETKSNKNERKTTYNETNKAQRKQAIVTSFKFEKNNIIQFDFVSDSYFCIVTMKFEWKFQT